MGTVSGGSRFSAFYLFSPVSIVACRHLRENSIITFIYALFLGVESSAFIVLRTKLRWMLVFESIRVVRGRVAK